MTTPPYDLSRPGVYGGFWIRLVARLLDGVVLLPIVFFVNLPSGDRATVIVSGVTALVIVWGYSIGLTAHWGCTLGKAALGLRVVRPDGFRIGWSRALRRDSVFVALGLVSLVLDAWRSTPAALGDRPQGIVTASAAADDTSIQWGATVVVTYVVAYWLWLMADAQFLVMSKRERAAHDVIGGTVVVRRSVAEQAN